MISSGARDLPITYRLALVFILFATMGCPAKPRVLPRAAANPGMLVYAVGNLSFEVPADWVVRGSAKRLEAHPDDSRARIEVQQMERDFIKDSECLADAKTALVRGSAGLSKVRRHPTTVAGRRAVTQEADAGRWHGWAYALCDDRIQYRFFLAGISPVKPETLNTFRLVVASARIGVLLDDPATGR